MTDVSLQTIALLLLRHGAGWVAGILIAHGWANGYTSEQIVSAIVLAGTIGASFWEKAGKAALLAEANRAYNSLREQYNKVPKMPPAASVGKPNVSQ